MKKKQKRERKKKEEKRSLKRSVLNISMLITIAVWIWDQSMVLSESLRDCTAVVPSAGQKVTQDREVSPVIS